MTDYHTHRWYIDMGRSEGHRCEHCHLPANEHCNGRCPITDADLEDAAEEAQRHSPAVERLGDDLRPHDFCRVHLAICQRDAVAAMLSTEGWSVLGPYFREDYEVQDAQGATVWQGQACCKWNARANAINALNAWRDKTTEAAIEAGEETRSGT